MSDTQPVSGDLSKSHDEEIEQPVEPVKDTLPHATIAGDRSTKESATGEPEQSQREDTVKHTATAPAAIAQDQASKDATKSSPIAAADGGVEDNTGRLDGETIPDQVSGKEDMKQLSANSTTEEVDLKSQTNADIKEGEGSSTSATPLVKDEKPSSKSEDDHRIAIQNEAAAHLARRASSKDFSPTLNTPTAVHRDAKLPAVPPPPPPPRKIAPEPPAKDSKPPPSERPNLADADAQDLPEPVQGQPEQTGEEIQHIIDQFQAGQPAMGEEEIMSPRLERQQPILQLPPRTSSLDSKNAVTPSSDLRDHYFVGAAAGNPASSRNSVVSMRSQPATAADETSSIASASRTSIFQPPPPSPDPEPSLPFDFHRFLEQLRHRTADPVARFLRSFLQEFGKKQWMVHEQVKIIGDFLEFIAKKMAQCEVWRSVSDAEFDNAREGMEKLVMNRLYTQTFSPAIPAPSGSSPRKNRSARTANDTANQPGAGRKGQHQEDVERDDVIVQKMRIYGWIKEEHLDIKPIGEKGKKFLTMAEQEILKLNTYRAPRDKVICVLNCCKVIFGFLKNSKGDQGADAFVPLLIYTVLRARPEHLVSNVQYIWRFRNQEKLGGEAGYYMSSLMGVVTFLENLDRTMITISDEEFEKNVEQAVSAIAEGHEAGEYEQKSHALAAASAAGGASGPSMQHLGEKSAPSRPEVTPRNSADIQQSSPRRNKSPRPRKSNDDNDDNDAVTGLLRTIQKPLSSIGRMFSDESAPQPGHASDSLRPSSTPLPPRTSSRGLSPAARIDGGDGRSPSHGRRSGEVERERLRHQDAAARQASVESAEMQRERQRNFAVVVETLQGMFPNMDKEVIEDVVRAQEGNVPRAVDACLALSDQS